MLSCWIKTLELKVSKKAEFQTLLNQILSLEIPICESNSELGRLSENCSILQMRFANYLRDKIGEIEE